MRFQFNKLVVLLLISLFSVNSNAELIDLNKDEETKNSVVFEKNESEKNEKLIKRIEAAQKEQVLEFVRKRISDTDADSDYF